MSQRQFKTDRCFEGNVSRQDPAGLRRIAELVNDADIFSTFFCGGEMEVIGEALASAHFTHPGGRMA
jgi:hypothetical protein